MKLEVRLGCSQFASYRRPLEDLHLCTNSLHFYNTKLVHFYSTIFLHFYGTNFLYFYNTNFPFQRRPNPIESRQRKDCGRQSPATRPASRNAMARRPLLLAASIFNVKVSSDDAIAQLNPDSRKVITPLATQALRV